MKFVGRKFIVLSALCTLLFLLLFLLFKLILFNIFYWKIHIWTFDCHILRVRERVCCKYFNKCNATTQSQRLVRNYFA